MARRYRRKRKKNQESSRRRPPLRNAKRSCVALLLFCALLMVVSSRFKDTLPQPSEILDDLDGDPIQEATSEPPFVFNYFGNDYLVDPVAEYEIWGMVVTHNNIHSIGDMYHDKYSVDLKDLCLIWGSNTYTDLYHDIKFCSDPFTCWYHTTSREVAKKFDGTQLSNNHLLSDDEKVRDTIRSARIGDQIRMKGMLVNYSAADSPGWTRDSSTVRTDTGNGACEVMFVEDIEVLKRNQPTWNMIYANSRMVSIAMLIILPITWLLSIYLEQRKVNFDIL